MTVIAIGIIKRRNYEAKPKKINWSGIGSWFFAQETRKAPLIIDLRDDPFEVAPEDSSYYDDWLVRHMYVLVPVKNFIGEFLGTFKDFPPRQESGSFTPKQ